MGHGAAMPSLAILVLSHLASTALSYDVGCYWYPRQSLDPWTRQPQTARNVSSLPPASCTYLDLGNLCLFNVTAAGRLDLTRMATPTRSCLDAAAEAADDVRRWKQAAPPHEQRRAFWEVWDWQEDQSLPGNFGPAHPLFHVFNDSSLARVEALVADIKAVSLLPQFHGVFDGINVDYEVDYRKPYPAARKGFNAFFQRVHEETGVGSTIDTGGIARLENLSEDLAALRPHIVFVEFMSYFNNLAKPGASTLLQDIHALLSPPYSFAPSQIAVGVGLSSASWGGAHRATLSSCLFWGWYGCSDAHSSATHRSEGLGSPTWDVLGADVASGRAVRGISGEAQGFARWSFYANASSLASLASSANPGNATGNATGEATFFNTEADLDMFAAFVRTHKLGGVFTWIATSDAPDWRVHRRLNKALNAPPLSSLPNTTA